VLASRFAKGHDEAWLVNVRRASSVGVAGILATLREIRRHEREHPTASSK
jgi:hypothetical protein